MLEKKEIKREEKWVTIKIKKKEEVAKGGVSP